MKLRLASFATALVTSLLTILPVHAAPSVSFSTTLELPKTGETVRVEHRINISGEGSVALELPVRSPRSVDLSGADTSGSIPVTATAGTAMYHGVRVDTTTFTFNAKGSQSFTLSYEADGVLHTYGDNGALLWSSYSHGGTHSSLTIHAPGKFGRPSSSGLSSNDSSFESGNQTYRFDMKSATKPIKMIFGSNALWQLDWPSTTLQNSSWWFKTRYLILPPDTNQQRVWLESVSPKPRRITADRDGNLVAEYRLWPKRSLTVSAKAYAEVRALFYNTSNTRPLADLPAELADYTLRDGNRNLAQDTKVLAHIKKFYNQAVEAAEKRTGDNERVMSDGQKIVVELSDNLRRSGIPAREVAGVALASREQLFAAAQHVSWLETYVPGIGWMTIDPLGEQYGLSDPLHIGLVIFGAPTKTPLLASYDSLAVTPYAAKALPEAKFGEAKVAMTRFVLVPGLSLNRTTIDMPPGIVLDNSATSAENRQMAFGSLAPLQHAGRWSASLGDESMRGGTIQFGRGGEHGLGEVLANGPVRASYLPIVFEIFLIILLIWSLIRRRRLHGTVGKVPTLEKQMTDGTIAADDLLRRSQP